MPVPTMLVVMIGYPAMVIKSYGSTVITCLGENSQLACFHGCSTLFVVGIPGKLGCENGTGGLVVGKFGGYKAHRLP